MLTPSGLPALPFPTITSSADLATSVNNRVTSRK